MAQPQKTYPVTKMNRSDGVYEQAKLQQVGADEFGKRKVTPSGPRKVVAKAGAMGKEDNAEGMPGAESSVETKAFDAAKSRVAMLLTDKKGVQDF